MTVLQNTTRPDYSGDIRLCLTALELADMRATLESIVARCRRLFRRQTAGWLITETDGRFVTLQPVKPLGDQP